MSTENNVGIVVDVRELSRSFRGKVALDNVSLQIPRGAVYGLIGLNGAGKTTLIRHLMGGLRAKHGTVRVFGQDPTIEPETLLGRIGYMTEEDTLPKWMRVGELIVFMRSVYPTWSDSYAKELCDAFRLSANDRLRDLSKGGRARVGLLAAIAHRPELLILDEPSSGLDPLARRDVLEAVIRTVNDDGRTVLFSSHLLEEVDRVCDSVSMIHQGKMVSSVDMSALDERFSEIVCRPRSSANFPPSRAGVFGWTRRGDEWSAVVDKEAIGKSGVEDSNLELPNIDVIEHREITLQRWFTGHAGKELSEGDSENGDSDNGDTEANYKETANV